MITKPCDPLATQEVKNVLEYLNSIEGKKMLTGQHTQSIPMEEAAHIKDLTGKLPAICGFELLGYSPNIRRDVSDEACLKEVDDNLGTIEKAFEWAEKGGLVTYTWHWFSPLGGAGKAFYAEHTDFDASKAATEGTEEYIAMMKDLDFMAELLRPFQNKRIPILWRPFHESDGTWFWWGAKGPGPAKKLWQIMFDYFTKEKGLHNLIWVWNSGIKEGYVGDEYCDIISRDLYPEAHSKNAYVTEYENLIKITDAKKGTALAEVGVIPDMELVQKEKMPWLWYMTWSHEFCLKEDFNYFDALKAAYASDYSVTLEDLPKLF